MDFFMVRKDIQPRLDCSLLFESGASSLNRDVAQRHLSRLCKNAFTLKDDYCILKMALFDGTPFTKESIAKIFAQVPGRLSWPIKQFTLSDLNRRLSELQDEDVGFRAELLRAVLVAETGSISQSPRTLDTNLSLHSRAKSPSKLPLDNVAIVVCSSGGNAQRKKRLKASRRKLESIGSKLPEILAPEGSWPLKIVIYENDNRFPLSGKHQLLRADIVEDLIAYSRNPGIIEEERKAFGDEEASKARDKILLESARRDLFESRSKMRSFLDHHEQKDKNRISSYLEEKYIKLLKSLLSDYDMALTIEIAKVKQEYERAREVVEEFFQFDIQTQKNFEMTLSTQRSKKTNTRVKHARLAREKILCPARVPRLLLLALDIGAETLSRDCIEVIAKEIEILGSARELTVEGLDAEIGASIIRRCSTASLISWENKPGFFNQEELLHELKRRREDFSKKAFSHTEMRLEDLRDYVNNPKAIFQNVAIEALQKRMKKVDKIQLKIANGSGLNSAIRPVSFDRTHLCASLNRSFETAFVVANRVLHKRVHGRCFFEVRIPKFTEGESEAVFGLLHRPSESSLLDNSTIIANSIICVHTDGVVYNNGFAKAHLPRPAMAGDVFGFGLDISKRELIVSMNSKVIPPDKFFGLCTANDNHNVMDMLLSVSKTLLQDKIYTFQRHRSMMVPFARLHSTSTSYSQAPTLSLQFNFEQPFQQQTSIWEPFDSLEQV